MKTTIVSLAAFFAISSAVASPLKPRCSPTDVFPTFDDTSDSISYSVGWTKISGESQDADCVEAYNGYSSLPISGGSFAIKCGKKVDRGYFDVYVNDDHIGRGDAYSSSCKSNCPSTEVFSGDLSNYSEGAIITVRNRESDSRLGGKTPYLDLNQIVFAPANC
ncbi:MAG: hypothetical protein CYPHOPRED_004287 [Cyphobasidiales sp. Tagirdzhanova-0007]|nr:MAG: hypothetical protein CYPHOPRED_004287 [Cyphobasidiales sp. Tagirdzhanova-0007]